MKNDHIVCIIRGNEAPPEDHAPGETGPLVFLGYVNGQWIELQTYETEESIDNGLKITTTYKYTSGGSSVTYYEDYMVMG